MRRVIDPNSTLIFTERDIDSSTQRIEFSITQCERMACAMRTTLGNRLLTY